MEGDEDDCFQDIDDDNFEDYMQLEEMLLPGNVSVVYVKH